MILSMVDWYLILVSHSSIFLVNFSFQKIPLATLISGDSKDKETGGATDYAALLQYLQFYQKQMEDKQK